MALKLVTVVGARPQFVKAATVSRRLRETPDVAERIIHTGQHYDHGLSEIFFAELDIPKPAYNLGVGSAAHGKQTGAMLAAIEAVLQTEAPDWVLVYGDTNSTLAGALAAAKLQIPVAHVEAGLRSFNRAMPEEINRILTDHLADLLFAPTRGAVEQLAKEGIAGAKVQMAGDVMFDAARFYAERAEQRPSLVDRLGLEAQGYVLATVHRAENTDDPNRLAAIVDGLDGLSRQIPIVLPLHPRTRQALAKSGLLPRVESRLCVIEPVGYLEMIQLERHARLIVTDSGGVQKEAFFFQRPCITLRNETEWTELVDHGYNQLAGSSPAELTELYAAFASRPLDWTRPLYGDGQAAAHIVERLMRQAN